MTRLFKVFLLLLLAALLLPSIVGIAQAAGLDGLLPPGTTDIVGMLTRWPANTVEWYFVIAGFVGMVAHWMNERRLGHTLDNFSDHFLWIDPHYSLATIVLYWLGAMLILSTVAIAQAKWPGAVVGGFALGWMFDSWVAKKPQ